MTVAVFPVGLAAALLLGLGYVLQQRVAATAPLSELLRWRLLWDLMHRPLWWGGLGSMIIGQLLGGWALQLANVGLVEPLLSTNLLFALAFANGLARRRMSWQELSGAVLLSASLGVFIAVGDPKSAAAPPAEPWVIAVCVGAVVGLVALLVGIARTRKLVGESVLLATGAGLLFGLQDAATRAALTVADDHGITALLFNQWIYIVLAVGILGVLLAQSAFKAARLDYSLPPITAAEPVVGVLLGIALLGDTVSVSTGGLAAEAACVAGMVAGVVLISRSPCLAGQHLPGVSTLRTQLTGLPAPTALVAKPTALVAETVRATARAVSPAREGRASPP